MISLVGKALSSQPMITSDLKATLQLEVNPIPFEGACTKLQPLLGLRPSSTIHMIIKNLSPQEGHEKSVPKIVNSELLV